MTHDELKALLDGVAATMTPSWQIPRQMPRIAPAEFHGMEIDWRVKLTPPQGSMESARKGLERELRLLGDRLKGDQ